MPSVSELPSEQAPASAQRRGGPSTLLLYSLGALICVVMLPTDGGAQDATVSEYQVKAAYLYNFAKFVEWPAKSFASASSPYQICILGKDPFREALQDLVRGKLVNGRGFQIIGNVTAPPQTTGCHILFVSASATRQFQMVLPALQGRSILIVGESEGFARQGGMINFVLEGSRVLFEVNRKVAEQAGLKISAKLLSVAKEVMV